MQPLMVRRKWCKITRIRKAVIIGYTQDGERVWIPRQRSEMADAVPGDIVSFMPMAPKIGSIHPDFDKPPKWFAQKPYIIGLAVGDYFEELDPAGKVHAIATDSGPESSGAGQPHAD